MRKRVAEAVAQLVIVALTVWIAPGIAVDNGWSIVLAAAAVALASWALRPALVWFARRFGWVGTALTALFAQAVILGAALRFTPGSEVTSVGLARVRVVDLRRDLRGGHVAVCGEQ